MASAPPRGLCKADQAGCLRACKGLRSLSLRQRQWSSAPPRALRKLAVVTQIGCNRARAFPHSGRRSQDKLRRVCNKRTALKVLASAEGAAEQQQKHTAAVLVRSAGSITTLT